MGVGGVRDADSLRALSEAIIMATDAHRGQLDKGGQPYILHPLRVMLACETIEQKIVAVLHDTVEDTGLELNLIAHRFGPDIANAVNALTRRKGESYMTFIERCGQNILAADVKLRDLEDNMDLSRLNGEPTAKDMARQQKYQEAKSLLWRTFAKAIEAQGVETERLDAKHESAGRQALPETSLTPGAEQ